MLDIVVHLRAPPGGGKTRMIQTILEGIDSSGDATPMRVLFYVDENDGDPPALETIARYDPAGPGAASKWTIRRGLEETSPEAIQAMLGPELMSATQDPQQAAIDRSHIEQLEATFGQMGITRYERESVCAAAYRTLGTWHGIMTKVTDYLNSREAHRRIVGNDVGDQIIHLLSERKAEVDARRTELSSLSQHINDQSRTIQELRDRPALTVASKADLGAVEGRVDALVHTLQELVAKVSQNNATLNANFQTINDNVEKTLVAVHKPDPMEAVRKAWAGFSGGQLMVAEEPRPTRRELALSHAAKLCGDTGSHGFVLKTASEFLAFLNGDEGPASEDSPEPPAAPTNLVMVKVDFQDTPVTPGQRTGRELYTTFKVPENHYLAFREGSTWSILNNKENQQVIVRAGDNFATGRLPVDWHELARRSDPATGVTHADATVPVAQVTVNDDTYLIAARTWTGAELYDKLRIRPGSVLRTLTDDVYDMVHNSPTQTILISSGMEFSIREG